MYILSQLKRDLMKRFVGIFVGLLLCLMLAGGAWAKSYTITNLGYLGTSANMTIPKAINNQGQIVGDSNSRAFLWENGQMKELPGLDGQRSYSASDINDQGQIVGRAYSAGGYTLGVMWENGQARPLGAYGNNLASPAAINNNGVVVGSIWSSGPPLMWNNGALSRLPGWTSSGSAYIKDINDSGQIIGSYNRAAFVQAGTTMQMLQPYFSYGTNPEAINNFGVVAGTAKNPNDYNQAAVWNEGVITYLGTLTGDPQDSSYGLGINDLGQVVGRSETFGSAHHAFFYDPASGTMVDLNQFLLPDSEWLYLEVALDINDSGQIIGIGRGKDRSITAFLMTPTPIPGAVWLLGSGMLGLFGLRRRMNRTQ